MTVSLVTYRHSLAKVRPIVEAVVRSACVEGFTVVDNSGDGPLRAELAAEFPSVGYVPSANRGFGAAHNIAIRRAMESGARFHAIVNPDIDFEPGTLERIEAYLEANPDVGLVMPKTVYPNGEMQYNAKLLPTPLDSFGRRFLPKPWMAKRNARYELRAADHDRAFDCGYLCGCFLVFRLDCLREVGLFDERFFMYPEDIDISRRVYASANWRAVYWPGATVVHAHEKASYHSFRMTRIHVWNMVKYYTKWGWFLDPVRTRINREVARNAVDGTYHAEFLDIDIDLEELSGAIASALGTRYRLKPLGVKCTYPVFRGEAEGVRPVFVKVGTEDEWRRTRNLLQQIGSCGLFPGFLSDDPIRCKGFAVFVMEWRDAASVSPEDMTDAQAKGLVAGCVRLSAALQSARDYTPLADSPLSPERLYGTVLAYARKHPLAGRLLGGLLAIPEGERTYGKRVPVVIHGDFHARNCGFSGDELTSVFDFDKLTEGLACTDLVHAFVWQFSRLGLSADARRRLAEVARDVAAQSPWPREELAIACNVLRLAFAARRIEKHPDSAWVALDILRRDRAIRGFRALLT